MKYISCEAIEQGIAFMHNYVTFCCNYSHEGGGFDSCPFMVYGDAKEISIDWEKYFKSKDLIREQNKTDTPFPECKGCLYLMDMDWNNNNRKLSYLNFNHWKDCDTNCIYCGIKENPGKTKIPKVYKSLKELEKKHLIEENGMVMFGGGDIAFLPEFKDIVSLFKKYNYSFNIATSATHYVPILSELLKEGSVEIRISVDSAKEETFRKIKRTTFYNTVWNNMKEYAKIQKIPYCVRSKFIIIPKVNDSKEEIDLWLEKTKECGVKSILLDIEGGYYTRHKDSIPNSIYELFEYTKDRAKELDLYFVVFDHASQMLSENNNFLSEYYFFKDITQHKIKECIQNNIENRNKSLLKKILGKLNL